MVLQTLRSVWAERSVNSFTGADRGGGYLVGLKCRECHADLVGRAGGVGLLKRAIKPRSVCGNAVDVVLIGELRYVVRGIRGDGKYRSAFGVCRADGAVFCRTRRNNAVRKSCFCRHLKLYVNGQPHVVSTLWLDLVVFLYYVSVVVKTYNLLAVLTAQYRFKRKLTARNSHDSVHGVSECVVAVCALGGYFSYSAENMSGDTGVVIYSLGNGFYRNALNASLLNTSHYTHINAVGNSVGGKAAEIRAFHLVPQTHQSAYLFL